MTAQSATNGVSAVPSSAHASVFQPQTCQRKTHASSICQSPIPERCSAMRTPGKVGSVIKSNSWCNARWSELATPSLDSISCRAAVPAMPLTAPNNTPAMITTTQRRWITAVVDDQADFSFSGPKWIFRWRVHGGGGKTKGIVTTSTSSKR